jgi:hypothetical protein
MKKLLLIFALLLTSITSCVNNNSNETTPLSSNINTTIATTQTTETTLEEYVYPEYINSFPNEMPSVWGLKGASETPLSGFVFSMPNLNLFFFKDELPLPSFSDKWYDWRNSFDESDINMATKLTQSPNFYSFYVNNSFSESEFQQIVEELNAMETDIAGLYNFFYSFSPELTNAIISKDETKVLTFCDESAIVKGMNYYTPKWVYYNNIENYKKEGLLPSDLIPKMKLYRNIYFNDSTTYIDDLGLEALELKLYMYAIECNDNESVKNVCIYDRDFSMPLPYFIPAEESIQNEQTYKLYISVSEFRNRTNNSITMIKGSEEYSFAWVYYNKPTAYKVAEITPDELIAMLPKYKSLRILSEEAMSALEDKINWYADTYIN